MITEYNPSLVFVLIRQGDLPTLLHECSVCGAIFSFLMCLDRTKPDEITLGKVRPLFCPICGEKRDAARAGESSSIDQEKEEKKARSRNIYVVDRLLAHGRYGLEGARKAAREAFLEDPTSPRFVLRIVGEISRRTAAYEDI